MARKRRTGRGNGKFQVLKFDLNIALAALAAGAVLSNPMTTLGTTKFRVVSTDMYISMTDHTATEGPIEVGIFNGDLSNTEVAEALDASPSGPNDIIARERLRRPVRRVGLVRGLTTEELLFDGRSRRTKMHTVLDEGTELEVYFRNQSAAPLTTGTQMHVIGQIYGYWI